jgi:hypothetical protein
MAQSAAIVVRCPCDAYGSLHNSYFRIMQQSDAISSPCDTMSHPAKTLQEPGLSGLQRSDAK